MRTTPTAMVVALTLAVALMLQEPSAADVTPESDETGTVPADAVEDEAAERPEASAHADIGPPVVVSEPEPDAKPVAPDVETVAVELTEDDDVITVASEVDGLRVVGVTWDAGDEDPAQVRLRSHDGQEWSPWEDLEIDAHDDGDETGRAGTEPVVVLEAEQVEVAVASSSDAVRTSAEVAVIDPGSSEADRTLADTAPTGTAPATRMAPMATIGQTQIRSRADWGADEAQRTWRPQLGQVTGAVVHHTATSNNYTAEQVPGIIRGIYRFHARERQRGDIGYNVLVDRFGRAWEGRYGGFEHAVIGAHASGANDTMFGISVIGNFNQQQVPQAAFATVAQVIGSKFSWHGITTSGSAIGPDGQSVNRVVGHRDVGSTSCPGSYFHARMGELTERVAQYQANNPPRTLPDYQTVRLAGTDRFETSVEASRWTYGRAGTVFVATSQEYADALAAGSAAVAENAPVLLVDRGYVPGTVRKELQRLNPSQIYALGGPAAISDDMVRILRGFAPVERIAGAERYQTAAQVASEFFPTGSVDEVYISSGEHYADALSGGAAAAHRDAPMLLTRTDNLPGATEAALRRYRPDRVVLVGGSAAVAEGVRAEIAAIVPGASVERVYGADRYATSTAIAEDAWSSTSSRVYYATGRDWPDALSGVGAAGASGAPLLLLRGDCAMATVRSQTARLDPATAWVLGGTGVVADGAIARHC